MICVLSIDLNISDPGINLKGRRAIESQRSLSGCSERSTKN